MKELNFHPLGGLADSSATVVPPGKVAQAQSFVEAIFKGAAELSNKNKTAPAAPGKTAAPTPPPAAAGSASSWKTPLLIAGAVGVGGVLLYVLTRKK